MSENKILKSIEEFLEEYPEAEWSFGHIVLSDYNLERNHIDYCLNESVVKKWVIEKLSEEKHIFAIADILLLAYKVILFLQELRQYSDDEIDNALDEYFGEEIIE